MKPSKKVLITTRRPELAAFLYDKLKEIGKQPEHLTTEPTPADLEGRSIATDRPDLARWARETFEPELHLTLAERSGTVTRPRLEAAFDGLGLYTWREVDPPGPVALLVAPHENGERALRDRLAGDLVPGAPCHGEITDVAEVRCLHVAGWMPLRIAAWAAAVTTFPLDRLGHAPAPGHELSAAELDDALGERVTYRVTRIDRRPKAPPEYDGVTWLS